MTFNPGTDVLNPLRLSQLLKLKLRILWKKSEMAGDASVPSEPPKNGFSNLVTDLAILWVYGFRMV